MAALPAPPPDTATQSPPTLSPFPPELGSHTETRRPKLALLFLLASHLRLCQMGRFPQETEIIILDRSQDAQRLLITTMQLEIVLQETLTAETAAVGLSSDRPVLATPVSRDPTAVVTRNKICNPL